MTSTVRTIVSLMLVWSIGCVASAQPDEEHHDDAARMIDRAVAYLRAQQEPSGGWSTNPDGPDLPAITGLVVTGMVLGDALEPDDPAINAAVEYILSFRQSDGGIYDQILPSYNTSICLSALAKLAAPDAATIVPAQRFIRLRQYSEIADPEAGNVVVVGPGHPFYGGVGYGSHGRPDNSNLNMALQALHDSGVPADDPAFKRALVFLQRTQMLDAVNDMPYADGSSQGGFIYSTSLDEDHVGEGESKAGTIEETLDDGTVVSRLRAYGSMTYAGFKSYAYADLSPEDPRVTAAFDWIRRNYTLQQNPGVGLDGYYYYLMTFARALHARGQPTIDAITPGGDFETRNWANDLIDRLAQLQNDDGSFQSLDDRWMENNPVLITAYALIALQHAADK